MNTEPDRNKENGLDLIITYKLNNYYLKKSQYVDMV